MSEPEYRIALRPDHEGRLDDVVVKDVAMFRMEDMGDWWWLCCYLADSDERICWCIDQRTGIATTTEWPVRDIAYEPGSMKDPPTKFEIHKSHVGGIVFWVRIVASNGQVLFTSEMYADKRDAQNAARLVRDRFLALPPLEDLT